MFAFSFLYIEKTFVYHSLVAKTDGDILRVALDPDLSGVYQLFYIVDDVIFDEDFCTDFLQGQGDTLCNIKHHF